MNIVSAVILCTIVGAVGAIVLVAASKFMAVEEDPRIEEVTNCLAGAKLRRLRLRRLCGLRKGCGHGRRALRQVRTRRPQRLPLPLPRSWAARPALWKRRRLSSVRAIPSTASLLMITRASRPVQPLLHCTAAPRPAPLPVLVWATAPRCVSSHAIHIVDGVAKVDKDKCTGCGACANICPKQVIMIDVGGPRKPVVMCSNKDKGPVAMKACTTSCIACGMCERTCKFDAIHVVDGVARIDYDKCKGCGMCAQKCPKHIILFPLKDDPNPPKPVVKPAAPAAAPAAKPEAKAEAKPETKAE